MNCSFSELVKKLPSFYLTRSFIMFVTKPHHWTLFWVRWLQSASSHPLSLRSNLISSSHLHLDVQSCPMKILYALFVYSCMIHVPHSLLSRGYQELFPWEVKRPEREADHSPQSSAEVKNAWAIPPLPQYAFMASCSSVKARGILYLLHAPPISSS
jgi:hypothetical protein